MKKKIYFVIGLLSLCFLCGCSGERVKAVVNEALIQAGIREAEKEPDYTNISTQSTVDESVLSLEELYEGYFILHTEENKETGEKTETYYALNYPDYNSSEEEKEDDEYVNFNNIVATEDTWDLIIPTLFLNQGDRLIYYSPSNILDYENIYRYYDYGYSIGMVHIGLTSNEYPYIYIDLKEAEEETAYPLLSSDLYDYLTYYYEEVEDDFAYTVRLNAINNTILTKDYISEIGTIKGLDRYQDVTLNVNVGSLDEKLTTTANYHFFQEFELFAVGAYEPLFNNTYEVILPDYLKQVNGYYMLSNGGMFRIVVGENYNLLDYDSFNTPLLEYDFGEAEANVGRYSEIESLNFYNGMYAIEGTLGYTAQKTATETEETNQTEDVQDTVIVQDVITKCYQLTIKEEIALYEGEENTSLFTYSSDIAGTPVSIKYKKTDTDFTTIAHEKDETNQVYQYNVMIQETIPLDTVYYIEMQFAQENEPQLSYMHENVTIEPIDAIPETVGTTARTRD